MHHAYRSAGSCAALAAVLLMLTAPAGADHHVKLRWSGDLGVGYDDNVGNAAEAFDVRDSGVATGGINLDYHRALTLGTGLLLRGGLQGEAYESADGLSNARALVMARLSHRPAGGFYMPTFGVWVSGAVAEYNSAMRDGFDYRAGVHVIEPLTTALSLRLAAGAAERRGDHEVFELSSWTAGLNLDWAVTPGLTLYTGYAFQGGDLVSSGTVLPKSTHVPGGCGIGTACDPDDALDGQFAYRVDADTHLATLGVNLPLSRRVALDAQGRYVSSTAGETGYERVQGMVSALLRF